MKTIMTMAMTMIALAMNAGGLYFVSGGDFRKCDSYWKILTTVDNQLVVSAIPQMTQGYKYRDDGKANKASIKIEPNVEIPLGYSIVTNVGNNNY